MKSLIVILIGYFTVTFATGFKAASPLASKLQDRNHQIELIMGDL